MTNLNVEAERQKFEKEIPPPKNVEWEGGPWYTSRFSPWDAQDYNYRWDGWLKRAMLYHSQHQKPEKPYEKQ